MKNAIKTTSNTITEIEDNGMGIEEVVEINSTIGATEALKDVKDVEETDND